MQIRALASRIKELEAEIATGLVAKQSAQLEAANEIISRFLDLLPESKEKEVWRAQCTSRAALLQPEQPSSKKSSGSEDSEEENLDWILDSIRTKDALTATFSGKQAAALKQVENLTEDAKLDSYLESDEFKMLFGRYREVNGDEDTPDGLGF